MILYLHGFRSSPASAKARLLGEAFEKLGLASAWVCPQLPASPSETIALCEQLIDQHQQRLGHDRLVVIGSSLGGFYATYLAETHRAPAAVLNPAVQASRDLLPHVGSHRSYHSDEAYEFMLSHIDELKQLVIPHLANPSRYYLLACTGDEVLNWQEMVQYYQGCHLNLVQGSDHSISDFPLYQGEVVAFVLKHYLTT